MSRLLDLDAYVTGEMSDADAEAFEEAMFAAPDDPDLDFLDRVARQGAQLVAHGTYDMGITRAELDQLVAAGRDVLVVDAGPPGVSETRFARASELVCTVLRLGRPDVARVDVEITIVEHQVTKTIMGGLVDPTDGHLYGMCERPLAELAFNAGRSIVRVRRADGARELLGEWDLTPVHAP